MNSVRIPRLIVCLLSIALLFVLGLVSETLRDAVPGILRLQCGDVADVNLPRLTSVVFGLYGLNAGDFLLSLTPFMLVFAGLAAYPNPKTEVWHSFWYFFVSAWLLVMIYMSLFALGLIQPFATLCEDIDTNPISWIVYAIDGVLVIAFIVLYRRKRAEP